MQKGFGIDWWVLTHADLTKTSRVRAFLAYAGDYFDARTDVYAGKRRR